MDIPQPEETSMYIGDQPIIGGIRQQAKKPSKIPNINLKDKKVAIITISVGVILVLLSVLGYLFFSGSIGRQIAPKEDTVSNQEPNVPKTNNVLITFGERQLPESINTDKVIERIANITSTSLIEGSIERLVSIKSNELSSELKQIKIQIPE